MWATSRQRRRLCAAKTCGASCKLAASATPRHGASRAPFRGRLTESNRRGLLSFASRRDDSSTPSYRLRFTLSSAPQGTRWMRDRCSCTHLPSMGGPRVKTGLVDERRNGGAHTSRTILLSELTAVLAVVSPDAPQDTYRTAVIEDNVLGKKTLNSRQRSFRYLRELYALDPDTLLFRALRDLWESCPTDQPLLAMLCALARDPSLRATAAAVLPLSQGEAVTADDLARALMDRYPGIYIDAVANKVGRNAASSWTQSGHLIGRTGKTRIRAACGPAAVAYALLLGAPRGRRRRGALHDLLGPGPRRSAHCGS